MRALSDRLNRAAEAVTVVLVAVMAGTMTFGIVSRFLLHAPLAWSDELSRYLLVWVSFLGASVAFHRRMHLGVTTGVSRLPHRQQRLVAVVGAVAVAGLLLVVVVQGIRLALFNLPQRSPAMRISMTGPYLAIPVAALLMLVHAVADLSEILTGRRDHAP